MLLAILATPLLALAGVPLRSRLVAIAVIIAIYVPVAGAGASIQRAGVMGVAGVVAALASRPTARWYALGLAAAVTLAIDPRATADIGWQLSFCAVAGLLVLAPPLIRILAPTGTGIRRALAEGAAMTLAASLATAPLAAHHFGTVSLTAIPANLSRCPAIAPAMWLGMLSGALGQIPGAPVEPLTWLGGLCAAFIGWVAHALGPEWAQLDVPEPGALAALVWTAVLVGGARLACLALERRQRDAPGAAPAAARRDRRGAGASRAVLAAVALIALRASDSADSPARAHDPDPRRGPGRRDPRRAARPPAAAGRHGAARTPRPASSSPTSASTELFGIAITHDELDHSGGLAGVLGEVEARAHPRGVRTARELPLPRRARRRPASRRARRSGSGAARIEVLWPPPATAAGGRTRTRPRSSSRVSHRRFRRAAHRRCRGGGRRATASGPVEFLKVAHHGSADAGLDSLLARTSPQLAAISVGADNTYGHPAPETLGGAGRARTFRSSARTRRARS